MYIFRALLDRLSSVVVRLQKVCQRVSEQEWLRKLLLQGSANREALGKGIEECFGGFFQRLKGWWY